MTADRLRLEDVRFYGHHGVSTAEQTVGVWFSVDAELTLDLTSAAVSDDLACAVDYGQVARSFGAAGVRVSTVAELRAALTEAHERRGPMVIDALIDPDAIAPVTRYDRVRTREL